MLKKYKDFILVLAPAVILLMWCVGLSLQLRSGQEVTVRIMGYDPRSLLSGHYIMYRIDWTNTDCTQFDKGICPKDDFRKGLYQQQWGRTYRFYVSEKVAVALDNAVRNSANKAEIVYSYRKGHKPFALRLLINGEAYQSK